MGKLIFLADVTLAILIATVCVLKRTGIIPDMGSQTPPPTMELNVEAFLIGFILVNAGTIWALMR